MQIGVIKSVSNLYNLFVQLCHLQGWLATTASNATDWMQVLKVTG